MASTAADIRFSNAAARFTLRLHSLDSVGKSTLDPLDHGLPLIQQTMAPDPAKQPSPFVRSKLLFNTSPRQGFEEGS